MFKSNLTHTLYKHFLSHHFNEQLITPVTESSIPSFVYVDGVKIKLMAGYYRKTISTPSTTYQTNDTHMGIEIAFYDND